MRHLIASLVLASSLAAQAPKPDAFEAVRFLVGEWTGEGTGQPGPTTGPATFRFDLEGKVLIRRGHADMPAANGRPAARHEDLLSIFPEGGALKALYLDNEEHVIRYLVTAIPGGVVFTSEPGGGPRFRLTYLRKSDSLVTLRFEMAPPGKPDAFATYLEGAMRRTK